MRRPRGTNDLVLVDDNKESNADGVESGRWGVAVSGLESGPGVTVSAK